MSFYFTKSEICERNSFEFPNYHVTMKPQNKSEHATIATTIVIFEYSYDIPYTVVFQELRYSC